MRRNWLVRWRCATLWLAMAVALPGCARNNPPRLYSDPEPIFAGDFRPAGPESASGCPSRLAHLTDGAVFVLSHELIQRDPRVDPRQLGDYRPLDPATLGPDEWLRVECRSMIALAVVPAR